MEGTPEHLFLHSNFRWIIIPFNGIFNVETGETALKPSEAAVEAQKAEEFSLVTKIAELAKKHEVDLQALDENLKAQIADLKQGFFDIRKINDNPLSPTFISPASVIVDMRHVLWFHATCFFDK